MVVIKIIAGLSVFTIIFSGMFTIWAGLYIITSKFKCKYFSGDKEDKK